MSGSRYDAKSDKIKISSYRGSTLQGPTAVISKKIYANESYGATTLFSSTAFRILGTATGSLLNARVKLVCPLRVSAACGQTYAVAAAPGPMPWRASCVGPRRNGLWKSMQSISTTVNSSCSFHVRPEELATWDDIFGGDDLPYSGGRETGTMGPDHTVQPEQFSAAVDVGGLARNGDDIAAIQAILPLAAGGQTSAAGSLPVARAYGEFLGEYGAGNPTGVNTAFARRRTDFMASVEAGGDGLTVDYDWTTCLNIPPFACYKTEPYQRTPTNLPFISSIDVQINWRRQMQGRFLIAKSPAHGSAAATINNCTVAFCSVPVVRICSPGLCTHPPCLDRLLANNSLHSYRAVDTGSACDDDQARKRQDGFVSHFTVSVCAEDEH